MAAYPSVCVPISSAFSVAANYLRWSVNHASATAPHHSENTRTHDVEHKDYNNTANFDRIGKRKTVLVSLECMELIPQIKILTTVKRNLYNLSTMASHAKVIEK
jgi:hypothetical protein